jgi:carbonic anhydrase/acetyltransferase-like protein (isoleucine patch superfamily)
MTITFNNQTPKISKSCYVSNSVDIIGDVTIGDDSSIWFGSVVRGDVHKITIGKRTSVQDLSMLHVTHYKKPDRSDGNPTIIGNDVTIGHKVMLHGCTIKDACLIGMCATIIDGAVIGKESIVGASSLITKNKKFPSRSLIMGNPAKVIRSLTDEEVKSIYKSADNYVTFKNRYLIEQ